MESTPSNPFLKKFKTESQSYIYDVNTNKILKVDEIIYEIIDLYPFEGKNKVRLERCCDKYGKDRVECAMDSIINANQTQGLFSNFRPKQMSFLLDEQQMLEKYDSSLMQICLNVSDDCNMRCAYCAYSGSYKYERTHRPQFISAELAIKAIDFFLARSYKSDQKFVSFYGGEPLLNFNVIQKCVEYVNKKNDKGNHRFALTSNGTLLMDKIIKFLVKNNFSLLISLDGPEYIHNRYRRFKNQRPTFNQIMKNILKLKDYDQEYFRKKVAFSVVFSPPYEFGPLENFFNSQSGQNTKENIVSFVNPHDTSFFDNFPKEQLNKTLFRQSMIGGYKSNLLNNKNSKFTSEILNKSMLRIHNREMSKLSKVIGPNGCCLLGIRRILVDTKGNIFMCEKIGYFFPLGDIYRGFNFEALKNIMQRYCEISQDCLNCWALRLCPACFVKAQKGNYLSSQRKKESCKSLRAAMDTSLKTYCSIREKKPDAFKFLEDYVYV